MWPLVECDCDRPTFRVVDGAQAPERVAAVLELVIVDTAEAGVRMMSADGRGRAGT